MTKKILCVLTLALTLAACGGGGGGGSSGAPASVSSTETFQFWQGWVNYASTSSSRNFTVSGTLSGSAVTGSGTSTAGNLTSTTFEGAAAMSRTTAVTGTLTGNGVTVPYNDTATSYLDSNYLPRGFSNSSEYGVISGNATIPQTARVNDAGTLYTFNRYTSSAKTTPLGTMVVSYAIQPDTASSALLKIIVVRRNNFGQVETSGAQTMRMTPSGQLTPLEETLVDGSTALTLTY